MDNDNKINPDRYIYTIEKITDDLSIISDRKDKLNFLQDMLSIVTTQLFHNIPIFSVPHEVFSHYSYTNRDMYYGGGSGAGMKALLLKASKSLSNTLRPRFISVEM